MKPKPYCILLSFLISAGFSAFAEEGHDLSLADAIARALEHHPSVAVYAAEKRLADAQWIIATARPNPELVTEIEDVLGDGDFRGFNQAVYNVGVSQLIETAGKRGLRGEIARAGQSGQELQYEVARRDLIVETSQRFVMVLTAQDAEENARENFRIAEEAHRAIVKQVEGGRGNAVDSGQALLGKNEASLAYENARREAQLARQQLSAMWAESNPSFSKLRGQLAKPVGDLTSVDVLQESISSHPAMKLAASGVEVAQTTLRLEERNRTPDVTVGLGYRRDTTVDDSALVVGFSVPLPLFDQNQGGIARAEAEIEKQTALVGQTRARLELRIARAHATLAAAKAEFDLVAGDMLEAAESHHSTISEGFALGRIKYLDLLEARRSLNAVRKQKLEALSKYHAARVELEALTGSAL